MNLLHGKPTIRIDPSRIKYEGYLCITPFEKSCLRAAMDTLLYSLAVSGKDVRRPYADEEPTDTSMKMCYTVRTSAREKGSCLTSKIPHG